MTNKSVLSVGKKPAELDAWVREVIAWHFDPETGCPFWLDFAKDLSWDPRKEIQTYDDLSRFGFFQDEWLRGGPVRRWVPKGFADRPVYTFETGGSTGVPKSRINIEDFRLDYEAFSDTLPEEFFPKGADWLSLGPTGPRRLRLAVEHLAQHRRGICFMVDLDPRWVIKLLKMGQPKMAEQYKQHVVEQGLTLLKAHENIRCLFTTPKLLEALCEKVSLKKMRIVGVFCGGTEMRLVQLADKAAYLRAGGTNEELIACGNHHNSLFGTSQGKAACNKILERGFAFEPAQPPIGGPSFTERHR